MITQFDIENMLLEYMKDHYHEAFVERVDMIGSQGDTWLDVTIHLVECGERKKKKECVPIWEVMAWMFNRISED